MSRLLPSTIVLFSLLFCGRAAAEDYFITSFQGHYEAAFAVTPSSITDLAEGVKRAEFLVINIDRIEMEKGIFATIGSLDVTVIEVKCQLTPRQFKEDSEYVQFSKTDEPIDKTSINPYKDWTDVPAGSNLEEHAKFICQWPTIAPDIVKVPATSKWDFVDTVVDTIRRILEKK